MKHDKEIKKEEKASKKAKKDRGQKKENWFKGYGEATKAELEGRIGSSVKRLIKFIGLSIIPIIYAVICILAFFCFSIIRKRNKRRRNYWICAKTWLFFKR
jgi:hypothetical protein